MLFKIQLLNTNRHAELDSASHPTAKPCLMNTVILSLSKGNFPKKLPSFRRRGAR